MPGGLVGLLILVGLFVAISWGARRMAVVGGRLPTTVDTAPPAGDGIGTLDDYFAKITEFDGSAFAHFFVTATHNDSQKFVQVSVGAPQDGVGCWHFDMALNDALGGYESQITSEANRRGHTVDITPGSDGLRFLGIDFDARSDHDAFARWVVVDVFGVSDRDRFQISWG